MRIEFPQELLQICTIDDSKYPEHPHAGYEVRISRRALKHYVEARKNELMKHHSQEDALKIIYLGLEKIVETISSFLTYEYLMPRHLYVKNYPNLIKPLHQIIVDEKNDTLEICSIHFKRNRNQ